MSQKIYRKFLVVFCILTIFCCDRPKSSSIQTQGQEADTAPPDRPSEGGRPSDNDSIFPARGAAAASISFRNGFFEINGKPSIVSSGEMHYARIPRALWRDRLLKAKQAGLNTIQTYVFWNAHEPNEAQFNFDDSLDLDAWLTLIEELGLYSIVRPGPYNCAEWEAGGLPAWLLVKPGMEIRNSYAPYLAAVDRYYEKVLPILAKHQIHRGGSLLMVQLENEHPKAWGTFSNDYLNHLLEKARSLSLEVPLFYSGLHHGFDPAGNKPFGTRETPWFSTEFWVGWFDGGDKPNNEEIMRAERGTWKILAFGGAGYDYYVIHGGTNFGYTSDEETKTSYNYRAPIAENGQLQESYFGIKRASLFAQTFSEVLASAQDATKLVGPSASPGIRSYVRQSDLGTIIFLDNPNPFSIDTSLRLKQPNRIIADESNKLKLTANEIRPILVDLNWTSSTKIAHLSAQVLTKKKIGLKTYLVVYGREGESGSMAVQYLDNKVPFLQGPWTWQSETKLATTGFTYPKADQIVHLEFPTDNNESTEVLVINKSLANRTWISSNSLIFGADYASDEANIVFSSRGGSALIYSANGQKTVSSAPQLQAEAPSLGEWKYRDAAPEADESYIDQNWLNGESPMPLSSQESFENGYAWYRTSFQSETKQGRPISWQGQGDQATAFLNGQRLSLDDLRNGTYASREGQNTLAILTAHNGRNKLYNFTGPTRTIGYKGLWGAVYTGKAELVLDQFKMQVNGQASSDSSIYVDPNYNDSSWKTVSPSSNLMQSAKTYAWFRTKFSSSGGHPLSIQLNGIDDEAWVYLNGKLIGTHADWKSPASFSIEPSQVLSLNSLVICIKNIDGPGGLTGNVEIFRADRDQLRPWTFHSGLADLDETSPLGLVRNWTEFLGKPWSAQTQSLQKWPGYWRNDFTWPATQSTDIIVGLRTKGLSSGSAWINGHNLGRFKEETLLYVPEVWLKKENSLIIFDTDGHTPTAVSFEVTDIRRRSNESLGH
ncbi:MAG: beta-galactosidase [Proteobacteria bacterium]|nr:beta-galactosidase [Pseudomonadota bacterium]